MFIYHSSFRNVHICRVWVCSPLTTKPLCYPTDTTLRGAISKWRNACGFVSDCIGKQVRKAVQLCTRYKTKFCPEICCGSTVIQYLDLLCDKLAYYCVILSPEFSSCCHSSTSTSLKLSLPQSIVFFVSLNLSCRKE
jgi:hypothetical protein